MHFVKVDDLDKNTKGQNLAGDYGKAPWQQKCVLNRHASMLEPETTISYTSDGAEGICQTEGSATNRSELGDYIRLIDATIW